MAKDTLSNEVQTWLEDIEDARKREKAFRDNGKEIVDIYEGEMPDKVPFNILYSNTETLKPALYSNDPRPSVRPKHKNKQLLPMYRYAATASQRMLSYLIDTSLNDYDSFSDVMIDAVQDGLLPGRGDISIKYDYEGQPGGEDFIENLYLESNKWDRVYYGYSLKWADVPWKAYEIFLNKDDAKTLFGATKANKLKYSEGQEADEEETQKGDEKHMGSLETAHIYQIWDRSDKTVKYISPAYKDIIHTVKDPLNFNGFFNSPRPLQFLNKTNKLTPTALYTVYENQAKELNELTMRIKYVAKAIKVAGGYNGELGDLLQNILDGGDNNFVPTDRDLLAEGGLKDQIWMLPINELMATLQQLLVAREQVKQVIYEITAISDIVRGQSKASETLGAQKIKEVWGTMRLKDMQKRVQKFVRQTLRMMLDVACDKFSDESWVNMTGLPYLTDEQFQQATQVKMQGEAQAKQMQAQGQQIPKEPPPEVKQALLALQQPKWSDVLKILRNDAKRAFSVDIETNSTLDSEATEDQKQVADFMNSMGQFNNAMAPMVKEGILPFEAYKSMLLGVTQRFRFGDDVENEIRQMKEPKKQVDPKIQKQIQEKQKELQKAQQELKKKEQTFQDSAQKEADKLDDMFMKLDREKQALDNEKALFNQQMKFERKMLQNEMQMDRKDAENDLANMMKDNKREMQSLLDKSVARVKDMISETKESQEGEEKESTVINNVIPAPKGQVVNLKRDGEGGKLSGAETEYIYED